MSTLPHDYMQLYRSLSVPVLDDSGAVTKWQPVDINKYLLVQKDASDKYNIATASRAMGDLSSKITDHFVVKKEKKLKVVVGLSGGTPREFTSAADTWGYAKKAFWGKACPEEIQITLQLVLFFKLETPEGLQAYCDKSIDDTAQGTIGLDCNGFVGNYLQHGLKEKAWDTNAPSFSDYPANNGIKDIIDAYGRTEVKKFADITADRTYVMGRASSATKQVINHYEGTLPGHIVITNPFLHLDPVKTNTWIMPVVEATINAGITESEYIVTHSGNGVFNVERGSKPVGDPFKNILVRMWAI